MKKKLLLLLFILPVFILHSCYYDNEEDLYPVASGCDTTNVTYSGTINPIVIANCNVCHSTAIASGGHITDTYQDLRTLAETGRLIGAISHAPGFIPMPQGGNKLSDCNIQKFQIWINKGYPQ